MPSGPASISPSGQLLRPGSSCPCWVILPLAASPWSHGVPWRGPRSLPIHLIRRVRRALLARHGKSFARLLPLSKLAPTFPRQSYHYGTSGLLVRTLPSLPRLTTTVSLRVSRVLSLPLCFGRATQQHPHLHPDQLGPVASKYCGQPSVCARNEVPAWLRLCSPNFSPIPPVLAFARLPVLPVLPVYPSPSSPGRQFFSSTHPIQKSCLLFLPPIPHPSHPIPITSPSNPLLLFPSSSVRLSHSSKYHPLPRLSSQPVCFVSLPLLASTPSPRGCWRYLHHTSSYTHPSPIQPPTSCSFFSLDFGAINLSFEKDINRGRSSFVVSGFERPSSSAFNPLLCRRRLASGADLRPAPSCFCKQYKPTETLRTHTKASACKGRGCYRDCTVIATACRDSAIIGRQRTQQLLVPVSHPSASRRSVSKVPLASDSKSSTVPRDHRLVEVFFCFSGTSTNFSFLASSDLVLF
jgi:hypothetical protein